jgi:PAS domain S-box-containing protein
VAHAAVNSAGAIEGELRYGGDEAFAPFESVDAQGVPRGFQIDLLAALAPLLGAKLSVRLQPWSRTEADFRAGQLDIIAMVDTAERRQWALFAHGHATPALAIYRRRERPELQDLQDLEGLRVAVLDTATMRETTAKWLGGLRGPLLPQPDAAAALMAVAGGQADAAVLPRAYGEPALLAHAPGALAVSNVVLRLQSYGFAVAPGNDALRQRLEKALAELEASGRLEALRTQWLGSHRDIAERGRLEQGLSQQQAWTWGVAGASVAALSLLGVVLHRRKLRIAHEQQRRRSAEASLQRAEEVLGRAFTHNPLPMVIVERGSGVVRDANDALGALLGTPASSLIGVSVRAQRYLDAAVLDDLARTIEADGALSAMPLRLTRDDGQRRDCLVSADRMRLGDTSQLFCVLQDITPQLERDAALRREYDALLEQLAQARQALANAHDDAAAARDNLQQFTRAVSHDLKAPLRAVQGFAGLLRERLQAGHLHEAVDYTAHIDRAAVRMSTMLDALARLARVDQQVLVRSEVDMVTLASQTWTLLSASEPSRRVEWRVELLPSVQADPDLAAQVWQNLLDNAWKYTARTPAAKVRVDAWRDTRGTWYRITDNGAGFDMGKAGQLFQPFQRMHGADQFAGTGIGLSLVRRIVEMHGGEVRLRSAPGVGTVAEFTLDPRPQ